MLPKYIGQKRAVQRIARIPRIPRPLLEITSSDRGVWAAAERRPFGPFLFLVNDLLSAAGNKANPHKGIIGS